MIALRTDPRISPKGIKPTSKVPNRSTDLTAGNETNPNKNITTNKHPVSQVHVTHV